MGQEEAAGQRTAARGRHAHLGLAATGPHHLTFAGLAPQLGARLVEEAVAVQPSRRQLPAVRVQREQAVPRDPLAALDEGTALALPAEAEGFEPAERDEAEAVVELRHVDVG